MPEHLSQAQAGSSVSKPATGLIFQTSYGAEDEKAAGVIPDSQQPPPVPRRLSAPTAVLREAVMPRCEHPSAVNIPQL
ncbi:hypothetical protein ACOMHN_062971 [Nucella lapillus]